MSGTVLFGDDGSAAADLAWMWINAQQWRDWDVDVLTAINDRPVGEVAARPWEPKRPRTLLDPAAVSAVHHLRSHADPRVAILEHPRKDVIVVGPRGRGLFKALHLGSTAEWLMHDPPAPLVIARRGTPVRTAVVCSDGSRDALAAARAFSAMPWLGDVEVTVVSVQQADLDAEAAAAATLAVLGDRPASVAVRAVSPTQTDAFLHVRDILLSLLESSDADLVVQGSTGKSGWSALRAGSIAVSLAAHARCSVFMAHGPRSSRTGVAGRD